MCFFSRKYLYFDIFLLILLTKYCSLPCLGLKCSLHLDSYWPTLNNSLMCHDIQSGSETRLQQVRELTWPIRGLYQCLEINRDQSEDSIQIMWLVRSDHVTWTLASLWLRVITKPRIGHPITLIQDAMSNLYGSGSHLSPPVTRITFFKHDWPIIGPGHEITLDKSESWATHLTKNQNYTLPHHFDLSIEVSRYSIFFCEEQSIEIFLAYYFKLQR